MEPGKLANRYSNLSVQCSAHAYSQPAPAVHPTIDFEPVAIPCGRSRGVHIALGVARLSEGGAGGDVEQVAVGGDAETGPQCRQVIGGQLLRQREGRCAVTQGRRPIDELRVGVEVIDVAFEPIDVSTRLPVASRLAAADELAPLAEPLPPSSTNAISAEASVRCRRRW